MTQVDYAAETGYYYCRSRYYSPELYRFISADVYADTGQSVLGTNMYMYCLNNPIMFVDPGGYAPVGFEFNLGKGWWARFDYGKVGNPDHWHVWKGSSWAKATQRYALGVDGSLSHFTEWKGGNGPPNSIKKLLKDNPKTHFDWDATRTKYLNNTKNVSYYYDTINSFGWQSMLVYTDGTIRNMPTNWNRNNFKYRPMEYSGNSLVLHTPIYAPLMLPVSNPLAGYSIKVIKPVAPKIYFKPIPIG